MNFFLANKFAQDYFIKLNIPTEFSFTDFLIKFKSQDDCFKSIGRRYWIEQDKTDNFLVEDTATLIHFFDEIKSLEENKILKFLGEEFYVEEGMSHFIVKFIKLISKTKF